ncbi:MAG: hypothetical protein QGI75_03520 [Phycisphaerales bacterium]|nr:hypothetical protein [Phycisphaerales bacterium]MDP6890823.1 hypothetical protein [Phycisphaerales bacterium]
MLRTTSRDQVEQQTDGPHRTWVGQRTLVCSVKVCGSLAKTARRIWCRAT